MSTKSSVSVLQLSWTGFRLSASKAPLVAPRASKLTAGSSAGPPHMLHYRRSFSSNIKARSYLQYMKRKIISRPVPPYSHVIQVGDPVLRSRAAAVDPAAVTGPDVQQVISSMVTVMRRLQCVGLSAPQVGVPLRILALEYPEQLLEESSPAARELRGLSPEPLRVFVNPQLRVLDGRLLRFQEACESISGFSATVPRYLSVEVSGMFITLLPMALALPSYTEQE